MKAPRTAFLGPSATLLADGIEIHERRDLGLASVSVRKSLTAALVRRARDQWALALPMESRRSSAGPIAFASIQRGTWLASCDGGQRTFATALSEAIGDLAAVSDQSNGYAVLRLSGPRIRSVLSKLVPLDLDARTFLPDQVAATAAAHIRVVLWRIPDVNVSMPSFELFVPRSYARSFWHTLLVSASTL